MKTLILIGGPRYAGKSTLSRELDNLGMVKIVTFTTREKRNGEIDSVDYNYISSKLFYNLYDSFIDVTEVNSHRYGVAKKDIDRISKKLHYLVVDGSGFFNLRNWCVENRVRCFEFLVDAPVEIMLERSRDHNRELQTSIDAIERDKAQFDFIQDDSIFNTSLIPPNDIASEILKKVSNG